MKEKEKRILKTFEIAIPLLTEDEKSRILDMGELLVFLKRGKVDINLINSQSDMGELPEKPKSPGIQGG